MSTAPPTDSLLEPAPPPHGVTMQMHASISARIAEGDRSMKDILDARDLSESQWMDATRHWMGLIADDVRAKGADATLVHAYSDAFAEAQDALAPLKPMDVEGWASLIVATQRDEGIEPGLAARTLSTADYLRLARHFARRLAENPDDAARFEARYQQLHAREA